CPAAYPLSLHDALPISTAAATSKSRVAASRGSAAKRLRSCASSASTGAHTAQPATCVSSDARAANGSASSVSADSASRRGQGSRSEEHTSELQSRENLV